MQTIPRETALWLTIVNSRYILHTPRSRIVDVHTYILLGVEHFGFQAQDLLLGHCRLPRDPRVLVVKGLGPVPLAPERFQDLSGPTRQCLGGIGGERNLLGFECR